MSSVSAGRLVVPWFREGSAIAGPSLREETELEARELVPLLEVDRISLLLADLSQSCAIVASAPVLSTLCVPAYTWTAYLANRT